MNSNRNFRNSKVNSSPCGVIFELDEKKNRIAELKKQLAKRKQQVTVCQNELLKKSRERQVMKKLKEKQNTAWKQYLNKKEAAMLDEIAIIYHNK